MIRDERGAIMLISVFFAVFLVSILYLGIGAGETVLFREHMQDAADSAALSSAITYARMMNVIVLINLVMAALVAILLTLKLVEGLAIVGIVVAMGLAFFTGGSSLAAVPPLNALRSTMRSLYQSLKPDIYEVLKTLHTVSGDLIEVAPAAVQAAGMSEIYGNGENVASQGLVAPSAIELPIEPDDYSKLCKNAGTLVEKIAAKPFEGIPGLSSIAGEMLSPVSNLAEAMSEWFCGDGGYNMPDFSREVNQGYPRPEGAAACTDDVKEGVPRGQEPKVTSTECDKLATYAAEAKPDEFGNCPKDHDCGPDSPFEKAAQQARIDCNPSNTPQPSKYRYQRQRLRVWYRWNGQVWEKGVPELVDSSLVQEVDAPPCGNDDVLPTVASGYNTIVHPDGVQSKVQVVCTSEGAPDLPVLPEGATEKERRKFAPDPVLYEYTQVPHIFGCKIRKPTPVAVKDVGPAKEVGENEKSPRRVKGDLLLGSETFQVRSAVFANPAQRESARLVRLGLWGKHDPANPLERLRALSGYTVAQAEFYYAGPGADDRDAWMWNMSWRARLRRFDLSTPDDSKAKNTGKKDGERDPTVTLAVACALQASPAACGRMLLSLEISKNVLAH